MKHQVYFGIAIRIIILFSIGMIGTFVSELPGMRDFFGDTNSHGGHPNIFDSDIDWGARHHWYFWMMFALFILSFINVFVGCIKTIDKHYPNL